MTNGIQLEKSKLLHAIERKQGIIERVAKMMEVSPKCIYDWMNRDDEVMKAVKDARESNRLKRIDDKEDILIDLFEAYRDLVRGRDTTAVLFGLKCLDSWNDKTGVLMESTTKFETVDYSRAVNG